jgi:hypothetical protein
MSLISASQGKDATVICAAAGRDSPWNPNLRLKDLWFVQPFCLLISMDAKRACTSMGM